MPTEVFAPFELRDATQRSLTVAGWLDRLANDAAHRAELSARLADAPFDAFFFEVAPFTDATLEKAVEVVLVEGSVLARIDPDPAAFTQHFASAPDDVVVFPNLGRDATLVVPAPRTETSAYGHLAAFVRGAPASQVDLFWRAVARASTEALGGAPVWLSTAGLGVPWLHFRLDSRPKYYRHTPFKRFRRPDAEPERGR